MLTVVLGQTSAASAVSDVLTWLLAALALMVASSIAALIIYRRLVRRWQDSTPTTGFTLAQLRQLRDQGQLSEEEYQRARATVLMQTQKPVRHSQSGTPTANPTDASEIR